jgi:hypothetical protein
MVVYELFEVEAKSPEAAKEAVQKKSKKNSVIVAASSLNELAHPVHLAEAQDKFGSDDGR